MSRRARSSRRPSTSSPSPSRRTSKSSSTRSSSRSAHHLRPRTTPVTPSPARVKNQSVSGKVPSMTRLLTCPLPNEVPAVHPPPEGAPCLPLIAWHPSRVSARRALLQTGLQAPAGLFPSQPSHPPWPSSFGKGTVLQNSHHQPAIRSGVEIPPSTPSAPPLHEVSPPCPASAV